MPSKEILNKNSKELTRGKLPCAQDQKPDTWQSKTRLSPSEIESLRLEATQSSALMKKIRAASNIR